MEIHQELAAYFPVELIDPISNYLLAHDVVEYIRFRAVCRDWRSRTFSPSTFASQFRPHRWTMRRPKGGSDFSSMYHFRKHSSQISLKFHLPELASHFVIFSFDGLLVLVEDTTYIMRLYNPFTRRMSDGLPPLLPEFGFSYDLLHEYKQSSWYYSIAGNDSPSPTVMFRIPNQHHYFAKPGDTRWKCIDLSYAVAVGTFKGRFYYVSPKRAKHGIIGSMEPEKMLFAPLISFQYGDYFDHPILLKLGSDLLLMLGTAQNCQVFKVDFESKTLVKYDKLGESARLLNCYGKPVLVRF